MTVTAAQITTATKAGLTNVQHIAAACNTTGCKFYLATAMINKESNGRNVWGNDAGGTFRGLRDEVTESSWRAFRHEVLTNGRTSNGVGPAQITWKGFFPDMEKRGLRPWIPADNIAFGVELLWGYYTAARNAGKTNADAIRSAGTRYNGAAAYGDDLLLKARLWLDRVGSDDYR